MFKLLYRPRTSGSGAVSRVLESSSECRFGTKDAGNFTKKFKELQSPPESVFCVSPQGPVVKAFSRPPQGKISKKHKHIPNHFAPAPRSEPARFPPPFHPISYGSPRVDLIWTEMVQESTGSAVPYTEMPYQCGPIERRCGGFSKTSIR